ncbi:phytanoyl-CoA dioxygenase [Pandoraea faecigallinarum]|uniref:Phytanoyl-CoA dioxygenase n=1 Tax=Pandoraea faecigallinarum TaxID=656179 RepID=A0A0H3WZU6_9BURK|nr:phytanoyl-CoA dioxygenase family protein [Pandoraea faecigallinarum]AKM32208.1 phytanoyl-CoA dioxygenase [Pandoraea faecigallinarum]
MALTASQLETFRNDGYLILPRYVAQADCEAILADARTQLAAATPPLEFEADVGYEGAPRSRDAVGGQTVRRLLKAYDRGEALRRWATRRDLIESLAQIFGEDVVLTLAHHNCVMTKHPHFGTATGWHRDIRYWSFPDNSLVSVWLALGPETRANGALRFIPGSHREHLEPHQLDSLDFLRPDEPDNQTLVARGKQVELAQGDVVLFHSGLFHAAGRNEGDATKFSVVFAYRGKSNPPTPGSRSASAGEVDLGH